MIEDVKKETRSKMEGAIDALKHEFGTIRTGRASLSIVDDVKVDYYGTPTPLNQVATLSLPDGRTIAIQPWEGKMVGPIEKAIQKSDIGINPMNDGKIIRLNIPPLTEERRKELVKKAKAMGEDAKVSVRNIRRESNDLLRKAQKDKDITEDELKKGEQDVQKITDEFVTRVDEVFKHKEEEILEV